MPAKILQKYTCGLGKHLMVYLHCTVTGPGQVQGTGTGLMASNILHRNVHNGLRPEKEP